MVHILFLITFFMIVPFVSAQPPTIMWEWRLAGTGDYEVADAIETVSGDLLFVGSYAASSTSESYIFLGSLDSNGDSLRTRVYDSLDSYSVESVILGSDDSIVMAGNRLDPDEDYRSDMVIYQVDSMGNIIWIQEVRESESEKVSSFVAANDDGFVLCGSRNPGIVNPGLDLYVVKVDFDGDTVWTFASRPTPMSNTEGASVIALRSGGYAALGLTDPISLPPEPSDFYLVRLTEDGDSLWTRTYGASDGHDVGDALLETDDGGFILVGATSLPDGPLGSIRVIKTDSLGIIEWQRVYSGQVFDRLFAHDIIRATTSGWIVAGGKEDSDGNEDYFLLGISESGDSLWSSTYPTGGLGTATRILPATGGGYFLSGDYFSVETLDSDALIFRVTPETQSAPVYFTPQSTVLLWNYPNPFNENTTIEYCLSKASEVSLDVFDVNGRLITNVFSGFSYPGRYNILFIEVGLASGFYFCRLTTDSHTMSHVMIHLK